MLFGHLEHSKNLQYKIKKVLNEHFNIDIESPKIVFISKPQRFFNYYTGNKTKKTNKELIRLSNEVKYFYDQDTKTIVFPTFRRNGEHTFKIIQDESIPLSELVHEWIHHVQYSCGGYGKFDFFDESCCEICCFIILGNVKIYSDYFEYTKQLWNLLDSTTKSLKKKYTLIKKYNTSNNKEEIYLEWCNKYLKKYPTSAKNVNQLIEMLHNKVPRTKVFVRTIVDKKQSIDFINELYKVRDYYKKSFPYLLFQ